MFEYFLSYLSLGVSFAKLLKFVSHIARYAPSSFATIYLKDNDSVKITEVVET